jgi:hypothetical protein
MDGGTESPPDAGGKYWEWSGKVQERGLHPTVLLLRMPRPNRRLLQCALLTAVAAARPGSAQAPLTSLDSAILASQPLKRLVISPSLFRRLSVLAAGLDREVVLCLQGTASGDSAMVRDFVMPDVLSSAADAVRPVPCAAPTLAVWHNHPWTGPDSSFGVKTPEDFCSLSEPDLRTVIADSVPFAVVSVGRARGPILCWWRRVQAVVNRHVKFLPRFPRQWLEAPSLAAIDPSAP